MRLRDLRSGFALRLLASVAVALMIAGLAGYELVQLKLRDDLSARGLATQRALAEQLTERAAARGPKAVNEFADIVRELSQRPESIAVLVLDPAGNVLTRGGRRFRDPARDRLVAEVFRTGGSTGGFRPANGRLPDRFQFAAAIHFDISHYALVVEQDTSLLEDQVAAVRASMLIVGAPLGILAVVLVWLSGGWALSARHRGALERATRDGLTDLGNHRAFQDELERACAVARRGAGDVGLLLLDLDDFKAVNDRYGHGHGDGLLARSAAAMLETCRVEDRVFRTGGDEFAVLLPQVDEARAADVAGRLLAAVSTAGARASVGVGASRPGMRDPQQLREEADAALYEAKRLGRHQAARFSELRHEVTLRSPAKAEAVRRLIEERTLGVAFQPIWDIARGSLLGVEALCRPHEALGLSGPAEAFDVAEHLNLVAALDRVCLLAAMDAARGLPADTLLFLNVAPLTLETTDVRELDWMVRQAALRGIAPGQIVVEITERVGARRRSVLQGAERLRELGFRLALDDVGTGDAGLEMLRHLDVDFVKVDRAVTVGAPAGSGPRAVLAAISAFAEERGVLVIAEGVEDLDALRFLQRERPERPTRGAVQGGQGFGLGRPQPSLRSALELAWVGGVAQPRT